MCMKGFVLGRKYYLCKHIIAPGSTEEEACHGVVSETLIHRRLEDPSVLTVCAEREADEIGSVFPPQQA